MTDEQLAGRISTISAIYNKLDACSPGLELSQFLRELGFQAAQAADYIDQRIIGSSSYEPVATPTAVVPAAAPAVVVPAVSAVAPTASTTTARSAKRKKTPALVAQARYDTIIAHIPTKITPLQVYDYISTTRNKSHADSEDESFRRLMCGYEPGTDETWYHLFHQFAQPNHPYRALCIESKANDELPIADGLHKRDLFLHQAHSKQTIDLYVDFLFRNLEIIKFTKKWNALDAMPGGRSIKKDHLLRLFRSLHIERFEDFELLEQALETEIEQDGVLVDLYQRDLDEEKEAIKDELQTFKGRHCRVITARNTLLSLYDKFGSAILLDPLWDATSQNTASGLPGRSDSFRSLLALFCGGDPVIQPDSHQALVHLTAALGVSEFLE